MVPIIWSPFTLQLEYFFVCPYVQHQHSVSINYLTKFLTDKPDEAMTTPWQILSIYMPLQPTFQLENQL